MCSNSMASARVIFEVNLTKIKGGCQSGRKVVSYNSKSELYLETAPVEGALKNCYILNWCLSHTEIFSKRRKIYSSMSERLELC